MDNYWYEWLRKQIESRNLISTVECAFVHGQVQFAFISGLITLEQCNKLNDMIPAYQVDKNKVNEKRSEAHGCNIKYD